MQQNAQASSAQQLIVQDGAAQMEEDADCDVDPDPTVAEDLDYAAVQRERRKYDRVLDRRQNRLKNELEAVAAQKEYVDQQRKELDDLQGKVDATQAEIQEYSTTIANLSSRAAALAAERARSLDSQAVPVGDAAQNSGGVYAQKKRWRRTCWNSESS